MITMNYKERYKAILRKNKISPQEVKEFNEAIKAYVHLYPNWKGEQNAITENRSLAS